LSTVPSTYQYQIKEKCDKGIDRNNKKLRNIIIMADTRAVSQFGLVVRH